MNIRKLCPSFLFPLLQRLAALPDIALFTYYKLTVRKDPLGVLLVSPSRSELSGNHAFIAKALENSEFHLSTLLEHDGTSRACRMKKLAQNAMIILDDYTKFIYPLPFAKSTKVIQVWHSTGAFKRMGFARMGRPGSTKKGSLTHRNYTHVTVSSQGVVPAFCEAFGLPKERIYPIGVPRTDLFFDPREQERLLTEFYDRYPQLIGKKLVLFAPTFRGDTRMDAHYPKEWFDPAALVDALPEDYVLGIKLHPFIAQTMSVPPAYKDRIIDFSKEREINHLLFPAYCLITDYSSVIFEYALLNKPIIFYLPDLAEYDRDRSFFYDFETYVYGPCCQSAQQLPDAVLKGESCAEKRKDFFETFLSACDGQSTKRFVDCILRENKPC